MLCAIISLLFYKEAVYLYLLPGPSYMIADRIVAQMKNSIQGQQMFHPSQFVEPCNQFNSDNACFLNHRGNGTVSWLNASRNLHQDSNIGTALSIACFSHSLTPL
jgi:hypothetical protein